MGKTPQALVGEAHTTPARWGLYAKDGLWRRPAMKPAPDLDPFVARIRAAFPELAFSRAVRNDAGEDHVVIILDDAWVFRFPRNAAYRRSFRTEVKLMTQLRGRLPFAAPDYQHLPPKQDFGGYPLIQGDPLTAAAYRGLSQGVQTRLLDQVAAFLRVLHSVPPEMLRQSNGDRPDAWSGADRAANYRRQRRRPITTLVTPAQLQSIDRFYEAYAALAPTGEVVVHGDLSDDHLLLAPDRSALAGVIDFGDAAVGDPALDFGFFWLLGDDAAGHLIERYDAGRRDPTLSRRSRFAYVRWRIELIWRAALGEAWDVGEIAASLPRHFSALGL